MTTLLFCTVNFYYIALTKLVNAVFVIYYISESYLFVVAHNVGFLKRFAGL